jgi:hypothetical protein
MKHHALLFSARAFPSERSSGAHRIATYLREHGWDIEVIDFAAHWDIEDLKQLVRQRTNKNTVFYGFSTFFNYWNNTLSSLTAWMQETYPNVKTVLGGQNVNLTKATNINYWVDSYGEVAMLELAKSLAGNTPQGLRFDLDHFGSKKLIKALHAYPAYNLGSYKIVMEKRDFIKEYEWLTVEFSRGCKFKCDFCNFPILGVKEDTSRSAEDFEHEMKYNYDTFGVDRYYVADETFNDRKEKIIKFADVAEKLPFNPFFSGFVRADLMIKHPDTWEHMSRLNFGGQYYGIETFNHASAKVVGKGMHPDKVKEGLLDIKNYMSNRGFYRGTISLIVGLPYDTQQHWNETERWLRSNWTDQSAVIFPLDVQDLKDNGQSDYTNVSAFSKNLTKYGLREMKIPSSAYGDFDFFFNWRNGNWYDGYFMWEHDTMNVIQAREIATRMQNIILDGFKLDSWMLGVVEWNEQRKLYDLANATTLNKGRGSPDINSSTAFIKEYTALKLNM